MSDNPFIESDMLDRMDSVVRIVNEGDKVWRDKYANKVTTLSPGQQAFVPYPAMVLWFGDPLLRDKSREERYRTDEYNRLKVRYGVYDSPVTEETFPKIACYAIDGERIHTVIDDPEGVHITPAQESVIQREALEATIAAMQKQLKMQEAKMKMLIAETGEEPVVVEGTMSKLVSPTKIPVDDGKRRVKAIVE